MSPTSQRAASEGLRWLGAAILVTGGSASCDAIFGVDFDDARPASEGGAGAAAGGGAGGGTAQGGAGGGTVGPGHPWTKLELLNGTDGVPHSTTDFVNAIWCGAIDRCVVATEGDAFEPGNLYSATYQSVLEILVEGDGVASDTAFIGLSPADGGLVARINRAEPLVRATGDFMTPAAWSAIDPGDLGVLEGAFNTQMWFQSSASGSSFAVANVVLEAPTKPGSGTIWEPIWAPPSVPSNYMSLKVQNPMLCDGGPNIGRGPAAYVSEDLDKLAFAVGKGLADNYPGACVSVDGAATFRYAPLPNGEVSSGGPNGLRCNDPDHCWLFGEDTLAGVAYVYYSVGTLGDGLTWVRANLPVGTDRRLEDMAFAPDNLHGFVVGSEAPGRGVVLATDDGGHTWSNNLVADHPDFEGKVLLSVFTLDGDNLWVGGEKGLLMSNGRAGR